MQKVKKEKTGIASSGVNNPRGRVSDVAKRCANARNARRKEADGQMPPTARSAGGSRALPRHCRGRTAGYPSSVPRAAETLRAARIQYQPARGLWPDSSRSSRGIVGSGCDPSSWNKAAQGDTLVSAKGEKRVRTEAGRQAGGSELNTS